MKILHVITLSEPGGAQSVVINLANFFAMLDGNEVCIVSGGDGKVWSTVDNRVKLVSIKEMQRNISYKDLIVFFKLLVLRFRYKPDVVHLHSSKAGILGRLAYSKKKIVYTVHGFDSIRVAFRKYLPLEKILQNKARYIVGVSRYDTENLSMEGIIGCECIYNGISDYVHSERLVSETQADQSLNRFKQEGAFIVMSIARLSAPKRFDLFCSVAEKLEKENIRFIWIGNQDDPEDIPQNVYCMGEIPSAHYLLSFADLFVLMSDYEGLPVSIIEAMVYSKPVLASAVGGVPEILNGENGYALDNCPDSFAERILEYKNNYNACIKAGENARKTFEAGFTNKQMCLKYGELYNEICL